MARPNRAFPPQIAKARRLTAQEMNRVVRRQP
jgi:hypothetical protein